MTGFAKRDFVVTFPDSAVCHPNFSEKIEVKAGQCLKKVPQGDGRGFDLWALPVSAIPAEQRKRLAHDLKYRYVYVPLDAVEVRS